MGNKVKKGVLTLAVTGGAMYLGLGCLGLNTSTLLTGAALYTGLSFVLDNDGVFDLFEDGGVTDDALDVADTDE
ncbi:MAG: hypothetical protein IID37_14250 [Planctomycetes bacterium]|nr:hypothetical protein [Planctomycetota bacterium]